MKVRSQKSRWHLLFVILTIIVIIELPYHTISSHHQWSPQSVTYNHILIESPVTGNATNAFLSNIRRLYLHPCQKILCSRVQTAIIPKHSDVLNIFYGCKNSRLDVNRNSDFSHLHYWQNILPIRFLEGVLYKFSEWINESLSPKHKLQFCQSKWGFQNGSLM